MMVHSSYQGASMSVFGVLWAVCRAPVLIPVRVLVYFIRLIFWPVPTIFRFFYRLLKAVLFPQPLLNAFGPLYFFFFTSISIGIVIGLCFGLASKVLQFILGISQSRRVAVAETRLLEDGGGVKRKKVTATINGRKVEKFADSEKDRDVEKTLSLLTTPRRREVPLTYATQNGVIKREAVDTKELTPADIVAYNDDRLFETFSSNATQLRYISSMPLESEISLRHSALLGRHPPTILEEEEEDNNLEAAGIAADVNSRRARNIYTKPESKRLMGLTERNLNTNRPVGIKSWRS
ncbi:uncharacterized protein V1513DRAFT_443699 [Lipomyces chichibuensis]|uniref:uncharacterized protein n=1 Tax=Lipomyces chichibuensis TaxID=1546026 RepID=UPI0033431BCE